MKILMGFLFALILQAALLPPEALADDKDGQLWFQSLMYVKHYDKDGWDWVEGLDNQALGLEYRYKSHSAGATSFINSFGDRTNAVYYGHKSAIGSCFSVGADVGISHGYKESYKTEYECPVGESDCMINVNNGAYFGKGYSLLSSIFLSCEVKNVEISAVTIGPHAAALKLSFKIF